MLWPNGSTVEPRLSGDNRNGEADFGPRKIGKGFHDGVDYGNYFTHVRSIGDGVVVRVERWNGRTSMQHGNRVYVDHGGGVVSSYSHLDRIDVVVGQRVNAGTLLGTMGATGFVTGAHLHIEIRVHGALVDPRPFIAARIATPKPKPPTEEDDMLMLRIGGAYLAALGPGVFRHFLASDPYEKIKNVARAADDWQDVSLAELPALLRTYGCDLDIWDIREGTGFVVLDPLTGTINPGNVWTATGAMRAAVAGIATPTVDPAPLVDAIKKAVAESPIDVDEIAIAKAVRGEFRVDPLK